MKTKLLLAGIFSFFNYLIYAQEQCGTESNENSVYQRTTSNFYSSKQLEGVAFCVNVFFHVIRNGSGQTSIPNYYPETMLDKLNEDYNQYNISFNSLGFDYIDKTSFSGDGEGVYNGNVAELFAINNHSNAIDVYITEKADWLGKANGILSTELVVVKDYATTGVLSHEMGHCLNLYHTHETKFGLELPDESNCKTTGDLICDTPADPNLFYFRDNLINCSFTSGSITVNGVIYYPDTKNLMSYTNPECMQHFSNGQVERMKEAMYNSPVLQAVLTCCSIKTITISQASAVCYSSAQTFYLDNLCYNTQTSWSVSNNLQILDQDDFSITVKALNASVSGEGTINATFNNTSQQITQTVHVGVPSNYIEIGRIESQFVDIFYQRWTRLFIQYVTEPAGWEWQVDYCYVKPSNTREILIYPRVVGPISVKIRRNNECGNGPWLIKNFEVIQQGSYKILKQ